jgi:cardiolipin synthase
MGNKVQLLRDSTENYPAWTDAIASAKRTIHFENYIFADDEIGRQFSDLLGAKARQGVRVRLIYDWLGCLGYASRRFWQRMADSGVEVRRFNAPRLDSPLGWLRRDHRKSLSVDGSVGFVSGLCVAGRWAGNPEKGIEPWRDTGIQVCGPAVAELEIAFGQMWGRLGEPVPDSDFADESSVPCAGDAPLRIAASYPGMAGIYRFDQSMAALAERSIWLTDAYFVGTAPYVKALAAAARDGVDVRLLLPEATDVPIVRPLSRAGYRVLLESGVRIFEWNGAMLHAKTAVADGRWARVGSSNLNLASWLGNWELDVIVEHEPFAQKMEEMYLEDLSKSTEIVLSRRKVQPVERRSRRQRRAAGSGPRMGHGSGRRAVTGLLRVGNTVGAAMTSRRALGPAETVVLASVAALLLFVAIVAITWPPLLIAPVVVLNTWLAISLLIRAYRLRKNQRR